MIQVVFAYSFQGLRAIFGNNGGLPWGHVKEDLQNFKKRTDGHTLIMGRATFESLPCKLKGRPHVVVSSAPMSEIKAKNGDTPDAVVNTRNGRSIESIAMMYSKYGNVSIIGGKQMIIEGAQFADRVVATCIIPKEPREVYPYDVWFEPMELAVLTARYSKTNINRVECDKVTLVECEYNA